MALEDIEKLKEKVAKDPNSKLFVPLADEYRKLGMFDDAVTVLLQGLENQPGYMSARVSLGKVYLEKQMTAEAREEFEKVIAAIPDNLFAHKKLAEICRDTGEKERAISEYKTVLKLNPLDEEALGSLNELQSARVDEVEAEPVAEEPVAQEIAGAEDIGEEVVEVLDEEPAPASGTEEDFEAFRKSIEERESEASEVGIAEAIPEEEAEELEKEVSGYVDLFKEPEAGVPRQVVDVSAETATEKKEPVGEKPSRADERKTADFKEAELFISQGNYSRAMSVYRELLSSDPQNKQAMQKVEELRMLLKMLGKEQEAVIDRLESFGSGLRKKRDEFLRNP